MGIYSQDELQRIRENIQLALSSSTIKSRMWKPDWSLHEKLGLDIPDLMTQEELDNLLSKSRSTPSQDPKRVAELWTPYINAEIARVQALVQKLKIGNTDVPKTFFVLGGASAAGKSRLKNSLFEDDFIPTFGQINRAKAHIKSRIAPVGVDIDPDNAKLIIPEFQAHLEHLTPGGANFVHEESRNIAEALRQRAVSLGLPVVYDTSGQFNNGGETLDEVRELGYQVEAVYFMAEIQELIKRAQIREQRTGRGVQSSIIRNIQNNLVSIIPELWREEKFDGLTILDSTDENITIPILQVSRKADGTIDSHQVSRDSEMVQFFGKYIWWPQ